MSGAPWSVKGIDPKAREVAKDLARRSGMTLGEWLNHVILEDDLLEDVSSEDQMSERGHRAPAEPTRLRLVSSMPNGRTEDMSRIAYALDRLTDRIEASETRTGLAINGVEHSVRQAVARIETAERETHAVAARADSVGAEQVSLAERLRQMESEPAGPRSPEALRLLDQSVARLAGHVQDYESRGREMLVDMGRRLAEAESRTAEALESLRQSLSTLDARMRQNQGGTDPRFEALAATLTERVEDARAQVARTLGATADGRVDQKLAELSAQVQAAERRSAQAIEKMGREVLSMAEVLNRRVQASEDRSADAIARVGGEMSRVATAVEQRMERADQVQAEALEKLGGEIGRMTERMLLSERRAAQAIDDVGEQVSRVTERIEQRHERAATDLAERIRQSEARTAALLDEARQRFSQGDDRPAPRFGAPVEPVTETVAEIAEVSEAPVDAFASARPHPLVAVFGPELFSRIEPDDHEPDDGFDPEARVFAPPPQSAEPEAEDVFAPIPEPYDDVFSLAQPQPPEPMSNTPSGHLNPLSTRDVIDQARAAARAAGPSDRGARAAAPISPVRPLRPQPVGGLFGSGKGGRAPNSTLQTALLVAGGAAFLSVSAAGVVLMEGPVHIPAETPVARAPAPAPHVAPPVLSPLPEIPPEPLLAQPTIPPAPAAAPAPRPEANVVQYAQAVAGVEAQRPGALARLRTIAETGHAPAQAYLGQLYENGRFGVAQNMTEARRWTARAASRGDATAMHNLALYLFRGEGGPQDLPEAAKWFRSAAERGVVNSQYNLGLLYQSGSGVGRDLSEAYKWFLIAAEGGDAQARSNAVDLEGKLTPQQLGAAGRAADAFRPGKMQTLAASAPVAAAPAFAAAADGGALAAQKALGRLGYYKGAQDGANSAAFKVAVTAYQRDQGLAATGVLDANTVSRLSVFTR